MKTASFYGLAWSQQELHSCTIFLGFEGAKSLYGFEVFLTICSLILELVRLAIWGFWQKKERGVKWLIGPKWSMLLLAWGHSDNCASHWLSLIPWICCLNLLKGQSESSLVGIYYYRKLKIKHRRVLFCSVCPVQDLNHTKGHCWKHRLPSANCVNLKLAPCIAHFVFFYIKFFPQMKVDYI